MLAGEGGQGVGANISDLRALKRAANTAWLWGLPFTRRTERVSLVKVMDVDRACTLPPQGPAEDVDVSVIDQFMQLSPNERLELHDQWLAAIAELRAAFDRSQPNTEHG